MRRGALIADRFQLERLAGTGATSVVYCALDHQTGMRVALKALRPLESEDEERFAREATVLAGLCHPGIVKYVAHGVIGDSQPYLVMEWLEGESLSQRLTRGPLSLAETINLVRLTAEALSAAHQRGIVHRDIKPSNLILCDGRIDGVKVVDFGVARHAGRLGVTLTGAMIGTPGYMAPEQARGEKTIDARVDVFALGCLMFRCLSGRPVFAGGDVMATVLKVVFEDAPRLADVFPTTPAPLDKLVAQMLSRDPDGRPSDGAEVASLLSSLAYLEQTSPVDENTSGEPAMPILRGALAMAEESRTLLGKPTLCIGREQEISSLLALFEASVTESRARVVVVTAEAGVGKSRIGHEVLRQIGSLGYAVEVLFASGDAMSVGAPFGMIAQAVRGAAGLLAEEPLTVRRRKLAARVGQHLPEDEQARVTEFLGELAFAPFPDQDSVKLRVARTDPMLMGDQMRLAWEDWLAAECSAQPVVILLEDLHWGDLPSVQFIDATLRHLADRPLMVLGFARPEVDQAFPDLWAERGVLRMELGNLTVHASEILVRQGLGKLAPGNVVERIVEKAAGNALFLEELVRAVAEGRGDALPESIMGILEARIAGLGEEPRRVLRYASIFGQVLWEGGVRALLGTAAATMDLTEAFAHLIQCEVIVPRGQERFAGEPEYAFRHALLREAAYAMLSDEDRRRGHRLAAAHLEVRAGERDALSIAEHFERAGEGRRAVTWYRKAAEQAYKGFDISAALARGERGIACGAEGEELGRLQLVLAQAHAWRASNTEAKAYVSAAIALLPWSSPHWYAAIAEAAELCARQGQNEWLMELGAVLRDAVLAGERSGPLWVAAARTSGHLYGIGRDDLGFGLLDLIQSATYADADHEPEIRARMHAASARRAHHEGDPAGCLEQRRAAAAEYEQAGDLRSACVERINVGFALLSLGAYADAEEALRGALALVERIDLRAARARAYQALGVALSHLGHLGSLDEAIRIERQAIAQSAAQGNRRVEGWARIYLAKMFERRGDLEDAAREARAAVELLEAAPPLRPYALSTHAEVLLRTGRTAEALALSRSAVELAAPLGHAVEGEAHILLVHAEALEASRHGAEARALIVHARADILARAEKILDDDLRQSFLSAVPEHARTLALAAAWSGKE